MVRPFAAEGLHEVAAGAGRVHEHDLLGGEPRQERREVRGRHVRAGQVEPRLAGLEAAVADEEDEHEIAGARRASATAPSAFWTFSRVALPL